MLLIQGNMAVSDIYFGEFIRLHAHYAFREATRFRKAGAVSSPNLRPLEPTDAWVTKGEYFKHGTARALRRTYFAGR
jgi:hypothetical protein